MAFASTATMLSGTSFAGATKSLPLHHVRPNVSRRVNRLVHNSYSPKKSAVPDEAMNYAESLSGVSDPFPNLFDPFNLLGNAASKADSVNEVKRWREAEITHGRVSMLAALGFITQEQILGTAAPRPFPHVVGPAINHFQQVETQGAIFWVPLLVGIFLAESYRINVGWAEPWGGNINKLRADYEPGNLGFDPLGLLPDDPEERDALQTKELNNGRLAMIAIAAFVAQELKVERPIFANFNLEGTG